MKPVYHMLDLELASTDWHTPGTGYLSSCFGGLNGLAGIGGDVTAEVANPIGMTVVCERATSAADQPRARREDGPGFYPFTRGIGYAVEVNEYDSSAPSAAAVRSHNDGENLGGTSRG